MAVISAVAPGPNEFSLHRLRNYVNRAVTTAARTSGRAWQGEGGTRAADATGASNDGRWKEARLAAANAIREARRVFGAGTIPKAEIARIGHVMRDKFGRVKLSSGDAEDAVAAGINWALNERPARLGMAQQADAP